MLDVFTLLSNMLYETQVVALLAAFLWGVISVLLSPCHLASVPLVMGYVSQQSKGIKKTAWMLSVLFALGILLMTLVIGVITGLMGVMLGDIGVVGKVIGVLLFALTGLLLLDFIQLPTMPHRWLLTFERGGYWAALGLGMLFGSVLGPCAFAFLMPILGVVFIASEQSMLFPAAMLGSYAIGHSLVIVAAGVWSVRLVQLSQGQLASQSVVWIRKILGVVMLMLAIGLLIK